MWVGVILVGSDVLIRTSVNAHCALSHQSHDKVCTFVWSYVFYVYYDCVCDSSMSMSGRGCALGGDERSYRLRIEQYAL